MEKVLIANRGEIAVRIIRTCREMGLATVAVYSEADRSALHTRYADEAVLIGPTSAAQSYLNIEAVLKAARKTAATAVHPGYGFLSENPLFCQAVEAAGMIFIGPRAETMQVLGDKISARRAARDAGLPVLPGPDQPLQDKFAVDQLPDELTFPLLVKAAAGGGGKGIRLARCLEELEGEIELARAEAKGAFGDETIYLEPLVQRARHIEIQILGNGNGRVLALGERECSIQRRHQKLIEEAPAPDLHPEERACLVRAAVNLGRQLKYRSLGTVEFLRDAQRQFYFIEVNPRIQVEHPVTEMITGIDLVREQIQLALTGSLSLQQADIKSSGAAIEARILSENPEENFLPTSGTISYLKEPGGPGIRVDSALYQGMEIAVNYDSLIAKVIAWGRGRQQAISRLQRALMELQIGGLKTNLAFTLRILKSHPYQTGEIHTSLLDGFQAQIPLEERIARDAALAATLHLHRRRLPVGQNSPSTLSPWHEQAWREQISG